MILSKKILKNKKIFLLNIHGQCFFFLQIKYIIIEKEIIDILIKTYNII